MMEDYTREEAVASVGDGWASIVGELWDLCKRQDPPVMIHQVKEKFGGLRFYVGGASGEVHDAIEKAERVSETVCEKCGEPGKPGTARGYWILTLCDTHAKEREERRKI